LAGVRRFADPVLRYRALVLVAWLALVSLAAVVAARLNGVLQGRAVEPMIVPGS
jgi:hypothetical protein